MIPEDAIWILELIRNRDARTEAEKDAVNAAIEALKAQLSQEGKTKGTTSDLIDRQAAIDALDCINGVEEVLRSLPPAQPEPTDINAKEAVYNLAEKIGIHQLFALTVELRGEPIQPEKAQHSQQGVTSDTISRQEVIDLLKQMRKDGDMVPWEGKDVFARIRKLPTVQPEPQWIPVEMELPEDFTDVLVWFEYFRYGDYNCLYQTHGIGTYVANYNLWTVNHETGWKDLRVIAWMPLPEPYKPNNK